MCSIIGYCGGNPAAPMLVHALKRMEYRGYDSVGIATFSDSRIWIKKGIGKVVEVNNKLGLEMLSGTAGIGHTRWATHGGVTNANAHPHSSSSNRIAIVHNGIIDNYLELKKDLERKAFVFKSDTDSEVIANLLQECFDRTGDIKRSVMYTTSKLKGSYAFIAIFEDGTLAAARFREPILIGVGKDEYFISSDVLGCIEYTDDVMYMNDQEFAIVKSSGIELFDFKGVPLEHKVVKVSKELAGAQKGEYAHFTLKEISEQPATILRAGENGIHEKIMRHRSSTEILRQILQCVSQCGFTKTKIMYKAYLSYAQMKEYTKFLEEKDLIKYEEGTQLYKITEKGIDFLQTCDENLSLDLVTKIIKQGKNVYVTGSGTSYNASLVGQYLFSKYAKIKLEPIIASEARFYPHYFDNRTILIAISQSGESADVLETVRLAKEAGAKVISIVNVITSSLVRQSHISIGLNCGPEIGVAATKSFTSQLAVLYRMVDKLCAGSMTLDLKKISENMTKILADHNGVQDIARKLGRISDIYVLGRGVHYPIACEAALKIKELTYIHAEGLPGGELKHGPLALMGPDVYVIVINPDDSTYVDTLASAHEIKARGAKIIGISDKPNELYDHWIWIPSTHETLFPLIEIVPIQLLAYYTAIERAADPDYPRNLAKSVTVK